MLKRFLVFIIIVSLCFNFVTVFAASAVSFRTPSETTQTDRLYYVEVYAQSDVPRCAALFDFSYDPAAFEFREASAEKPAQIESYDTGDHVKLAYLNIDGADCSMEDVLFLLTFKTKQEGSYSFAYSVSQCVDENAEFLDVGELRAGNVTVTGRSGSSSNGKAESEKKTAATASKKKSSGSVTGEPLNETMDESLHDYGTLTGNTESDAYHLDIAAVVILCVVSMVLSAVAVLGVLKIRSLRKQANTEGYESALTDEEKV